MRAERGVRLDRRGRVHPGLLAVAGHLRAVRRAPDVLPPHGLGADLARPDGDERPQHLELLLAHALRPQVDRRFHGDEAQQLQHVVLDHVAQRARRLVVAAAPLDAERLGHGDLHVVHVPVVPDRLEDPVAEAQQHDVLHGLLAEVVVDAEHLLLGERRGDARVERPGAAEVASERLLHDDAREAGGLVREPRRAEALHDAGAGVGRRGEVVEPVRGVGEPRPAAPRSPRGRRTRNARTPLSRRRRPSAPGRPGRTPPRPGQRAPGCGTPPSSSRAGRSRRAGTARCAPCGTARTAPARACAG